MPSEELSIVALSISKNFISLGEDTAQMSFIQTVETHVNKVRAKLETEYKKLHDGLHKMTIKDQDYLNFLIQIENKLDMMDKKKVVEHKNEPSRLIE